MSYGDYGYQPPKTPVTPSKDLDRILSMPTRRDVHELPGGTWRPELDSLTPEQVTAAFRTPKGSWTLKPLQSRTLVEAARARGLVGRLPVGRGKSLCALLLPEVLNAQRALLLIPAALMGSLERETKKYEPHFRLPLHRIAKVMSHAELSLPSSTALLETLQPDAIIIDEVDAFANRESVRTDRLLKYGRKHPETRWAVLSGTVFQKSVLDAVYWFALGLRTRSPLPLQRSEIETWVDVLDPIPLGQESRNAGALMRMCQEGETPRQAWNRRAAETVGVITSNDDALGVSLNIHERVLEVPDLIKETLRQLRKTWTRPDGKEFSMALDLARLERQISAGFYYRWVEEPPPEWLTARNNWERAKRRRLQGTRRTGMDSPHLIEEAAERGFDLEELRAQIGSTLWPPDELQLLIKNISEFPNFDSPEWKVWRKLKHLPEPETEAITLSDYLAADAADWGQEHVGIIWYVHEHVGQRIAALGNFPLYGAGNDGILDEDGTRTVVASVRAHGVGKNLQAFNKALLTEMIASGQGFEQLIGRMHRDGQKALQVDFYIYRHCAAYKKSWATATRKARFMRDMNGNDQRLLYAAKTFAEEGQADGEVAALGFTEEDFAGMDELSREDDLTG